MKLKQGDLIHYVYEKFMRLIMAVGKEKFLMRVRLQPFMFPLGSRFQECFPNKMPRPTCQITFLASNNNKNTLEAYARDLIPLTYTQTITQSHEIVEKLNGSLFVHTFNLLPSLLHFQCASRF